MAIDPKTGKETVDNSGQGAGQGGNDPTKNGTGTSATLDLSKVGDEDFNKVFDDPRIWKHPRFKSLGERAKKADDYEKAQQDAEAERLKQQGKFQELADNEKKRANDLQTKLEKAVIDNKIIAEATKAGVVDVEAVLALIDRKDIKLNADGTVAGIDVAVKTLLDSKTYLKGNGSTTTIGTGTNPSGQSATGKRFKLSQIQNAEFYRANEKDILQSIKLGLVEDDVNKR